MKGHTNIMQYHKYMFQDSLTTLMIKSVIEKKYWLLTIKASRICFEKQQKILQICNPSF